MKNLIIKQVLSTITRNNDETPIEYYKRLEDTLQELNKLNKTPKLESLTNEIDADSARI